MSNILKLSRKVVLRDEMNAKIEEYKKAELEYAIDVCPFSIGDKVTVLGWTHTGKKGIVNSIIGADGAGWRGHWIVKGIVLRKDGSKGVNFFDFNEGHYHDELKRGTK